MAAISAPRRLPHPVSPFVGRQEAIDTVTACLESARLVTLTGPGGVGKTRLAIQVAHGIADDHLDGAWFVDLSRLSDPTLVPQAVASVLAVQEQPERPLTETLAEHVQTRQLLLVLDNCEHLLPACAELVEALLAGSPALRVLATSRQSLGLTGEIAWPVSGLSVPPSDKGGRGSDQAPNPQPLTPDALLEFEAARLFVERAQGAAPLFRLTGRAVHSVGEICRRLEGIPLALELAAARLKSLSVEEIAARLDDSFRLLTGGSRTAQPRQQTLRATMDWSYELLPEPERLLLQRLSVFAGSFSLKAVEAVGKFVDTGQWIADNADPAGGAKRNAAPPGPTTHHPPLTTDVLDLLTQLVDKSLVVVEAGQETRYRLLETVRQYALERLQAGTSPGGEGEEERVRGRHLDFYLRLAEEAGPYVEGPDQAAWLGRLEVERDNLRTALDWALERQPELALRLTAALVGFWTEYRCLEEGRRRLAAALKAAGPARHTPAGTRVVTDLGWLAFLGDDFAAARPCFEEGLAVWRELGDPEGIAHALWGLGHVARREQAYAEARALQEESLAIRRELEDWPGIAHSLIGLGETLQEEGADPSTWAGYYEEALAIRRELGDRPGVAAALGQLAHVAGRQGDHARAREYREESLAVWRALGSRIGVIHSFGALGHLARDQGKYAEARAFYTQSLRLRWELGDRYTLVQGLEDFAELAARERDWARLTRLLGTTEALREEMANPLLPRERAEYDQYLSSARAALGEAAAAAEWDAGRALSLEEAVAFALARG